MEPGAGAEAPKSGHGLKQIHGPVHELGKAVISVLGTRYLRKHIPASDTSHCSTGWDGLTKQLIGMVCPRYQEQGAVTDRCQEMCLVVSMCMLAVFALIRCVA